MNYKRIFLILFLMLGVFTGCKSSEMEKLNKEAYGFYEAKDFTKALELYTQAIEKFPEYSDFYANRGLAYYDGGQVDLGIADLDKAIELSTKNPLAYANRAYVNLGLGYNNSALEDLQKALKYKDQLESEDALYSVYLNMGTVKNNIDQKEDALTWYDQAIKLRDDDPSVYNAKGMVLLDLEKYEEAMNNFNKAIDLNQFYGYAYGNRASLYMIQKKYDIALADVNTGIEVDSEIPQLYAIKGQILTAMGQTQSAINSYTTVLEKYPGYADVYMLRALEYSKVEDYTDAILDYKFAIQYGVNEGYKGLGSMFNKIGQYSDAIDSYNAYIDAVGDDLECYLEMGKIYVVMGDYDLALAEFKLALILDPGNESALNEINILEEK
ncbi:MAG: tetratricopeptide repeat protein [Vallitaleaceae bacterium]|nr:tetratricopeptide repeat protein [Vallitaleaceae bacterium]